MRDLFLSDQYQPGYFDYYVQFTLVNRAIECIRDVLSHQPATPIFLVLLREEFRVYFGYRTGLDPMEFIPMWTPTMRYNHWNNFVHVLSTSKFGHAHARLLEALTDKRTSERILKKLNTWTKEEQKSYHFMINQLSVLQKDNAKAKLTRMYLTDPKSLDAVDLEPPPPHLRCNLNY